MNNIETMKLALEALEDLLDNVPPLWECAERAQDTITSLRQAIERAQQQEPRQEAQIVNWNCPCGNTVTFRGFTQAPPPRQPLTDEQWQEIANLTGCLRIEKRGRDAIMRIFDKAAHGIKGEA